MEFIFEIILELILDGSIELSKNKKMPKYIRYPLIMIISLFFISVIGLIFFAGILMLKENTFFGLLIIFIGFVLITAVISAFRDAYLSKTNKK